VEVSRGGSEPSNGNASNKRDGPPYQKVIAILFVVILILGLVVAYQLLQLSSLSNVISQQSSELASPSSDISISNFTVTKLNTTSRPIMFLVLSNNGTSPASSGTFLLGVSGQTTFQSCYNSSENFFPVFANESVEIVVPLVCGGIGDTAVLTATIVFLTAHGSVTKTFYARSTVDQSRFSLPTAIVSNQVGIWTLVVPYIFQGNTVYEWYLTVTNYSTTPIVSVNASAIFPNGELFTTQGCAVLPPSFYSVSSSRPLPPGDKCQNDNILPTNLRPSIGDHLQVMVRVTFSNQTISTASAIAIVDPPYVFFQ
jgi:hypothetical protein